jgi:hypothetical protein
VGGQIGFVTIFGYAVLLVCLLPVQSLFARQFGRIRKLTVGIRDKRVRILSDVILGMQVRPPPTQTQREAEKGELDRERETHTPDAT